MKSTLPYSNPPVAVLLASYQGVEWISEQVQTILTQERVKKTLFISDDGSTDGTQQWLQQNQADFEYSLLPNKRSGSAATNFFRLIRETDFSDYDYVALSDQDDIWLPDKFARAVESLQASGCAGYSSNVMASWPNGKQKLINKAQPQREFDYMFESAGPGCTFVMTKKLALALQSFLIEHQNTCKAVALHDWFIYAFARSRGFKWFIDHESHILYRQHSGNVVGANVGIKAKFARWTKLREGWLINQAKLIANLLGYEDSWPIVKLQRYSLSDRLALIKNVNKLRRRLRDQIALAFFLLLPFKRWIQE